jgi:subtilisin family serine protease
MSLASVAAASESSLHLVLLKGKGVSSSFQQEVDQLGGTITYSHKIGIAFVSGLTDDAAAQLGGSKGVQEIMPDVAFEMSTPSISVPEAAAAVPASPEDPTTSFFYPRQWHLRAISADIAWMMGRTGSPDITVAILDTGIDYTYPDLAGLVDLDRSASFTPEDDVFVDFFFPGRHPISDIGYHGTHVAATVASNGFVGAGVTSGTTLIGAKVCSVALGFCPGNAIIEGILHSVDAGAHIANMSLGGGFPKNISKGYVGFLNRVFNYANSNGVLVVVSAGNEAIDLDHDGNFYKTFCSTPNTVCVSATGPTSSAGVNGPWDNVDALASYSNYGRSAINVAAPGGNSGGSVWAACSQTSLVIPICQTGNFILGLGGTSMAAPHVSGVAALIAEDIGRNPGRIKTKLQQSADDLGQPGTDPAYGKGRINAAHAVSY